MSATFTLRLMMLECLTAQEFDGDEIYLKLNGQLIWTWTAQHERFSHVHGKPNVIDKLDFAGGRKHKPDGWHSAPEIDPNAFVFPDLTDDAVLEIWDDDRFNSDDLLGRLHVRLREAGHGDITQIFRNDGAFYRLTFQVQAGHA